MEFNDFKNTTLGSWAIEENLFQWLIDNVESGSSILELGSGAGTIHMAERWRVTSIEHNEAFINLSKKSEYIHAPIVDGWYDTSKLQNLPFFNVLLIDGPASMDGERIGFMEFSHLFKGIENAAILIDDVNRNSELMLLNNLSVLLNKTYKIYEGKEKSFAVIQ